MKNTCGALFVLCLLGLGAGKEQKLSTEELQLNNGLNRGKWGDEQLCSSLSRAASFEIKYSSEDYVDNTGVNAVKLYCQKDGALTGSITSTEGSYGKWQGIRACKNSTYLVAMRADVMPDQGTFGDDEGVVNLEMKCEDGTIMNGRFDGVDTKEKKDLDGGKKNPEVARENVVVDGKEVEAVHVKISQNGKVGEYSNWVQCTKGNKICGLKTQVEPESTFSDDAGLCNLIMYCCSPNEVPTI